MSVMTQNALGLLLLFLVLLGVGLWRTRSHWLPQAFQEAQERRKRQQQDRFLLKVYHQGFNARLAGLPCFPPEGFNASAIGDARDQWVLGWQDADAEAATGYPLPSVLMRRAS